MIHRYPLARLGCKSGSGNHNHERKGANTTREKRAEALFSGVTGMVKRGREIARHSIAYKEPKREAMTR